MRKLILSLLTCPIFLSAFSQQTSGPIFLIPEPVSQQLNQGVFTLPASILIEAPGQSPNLPNPGPI